MDLENNENIENKSEFKKANWFNRPTTLSKILTMILFIVLPFVGFYLGINYQKMITENNYLIQTEEDNLRVTPSPVQTVNNDTTYKLVSDEDEQEALKEATVKYYNDYAKAKYEAKDIGIGYPFIKYKDWYYLNAGFIGVPSGFSVYIRKDKNELKVFYLGQECPPENLVTKYPDESDKIPIDALNLRCSPYYTVNPK